MLTVEDSLFMIISYLTGGSSSSFSILFNYATGFQFLYYKFFQIQDLENCILALLSFYKGDIYGSVERKGEWLMWPRL
jgi:hypothetical protein